jgi:Tfp pilus assembly protein PilF
MDKILKKYRVLFFVLILASINGIAEQRPPYADGIERGLQYFENRQYDLAADEFSAVLKKYPGNPVASYNLGLAQYRKGQFSQAIDSFDITARSKSYYRGPATYYKAISLMNLGQNDDALKLARNYEQKNFITARMTELASAIQTGTDTAYESAVTDEHEGNYELCLLDLEESVLTDTIKGRDLSTRCLYELKGRPLPELDTTYYKLYLDSQVTQSDNIYETNSDAITKSIYSVEVGGEYLFRNFIDYGIGASYNYLNGNDLPNFKRETININIPTYLRKSHYTFGLSPYYELNKLVASDVYSATGAEFHTTSSDRNNYVYGIVGKYEKRTSLDDENSYLAGDYGFTRFFGTKYFGSFSINANTSFENTDSGDQPIGPYKIPAANKALAYGLGISYDFDEHSTLNLRGSITDRDYTHVVSPLGTDRMDHTRRWALAYYLRFNKNVRGFLQYGSAKNESNYNETEIIDRNYSENTTSLGISLLSY